MAVEPPSYRAFPAKVSHSTGCPCFSKEPYPHRSSRVRYIPARLMLCLRNGACRDCCMQAKTAALPISSGYSSPIQSGWQSNRCSFAVCHIVRRFLRYFSAAESTSGWNYWTAQSCSWQDRCTIIGGHTRWQYDFRLWLKRTSIDQHEWRFSYLFCCFWNDGRNFELVWLH